MFGNIQMYREIQNQSFGAFKLSNIDIEKPPNSRRFDDCQKCINSLSAVTSHSLSCLFTAAAAWSQSGSLLYSLQQST